LYGEWDHLVVLWLTTVQSQATVIFFPMPSAIVARSVILERNTTPRCAEADAQETDTQKTDTQEADAETDAGMVTPSLEILNSDVFKILLVLFLSFLIGLEREEKKATPEHYAFGGVRTYPLIGLIGYSMAFLSTGHLALLSVGLGVISLFMLLSYWHKVKVSPESGLTSELAGVAIYLVGVLVYYQHFWVATTLATTSLILLELKAALEGLARRFSPNDIFVFTEFLLLTIVILPILPNQGFGPFQINPFKVWLVLVAVSGVSYASFLLQHMFQGQPGIWLIALLGGAYSSTVTTVALAKRSRSDHNSDAYVGGILMASGMMYLRLALLISLFNQDLRHRLIIPFGLLALGAIGAGWLWSLHSDTAVASSRLNHTYRSKNPLELRAGLVFVLLFMGLLILTHYTTLYLGKAGVYTLAGIMGVTDVDPFILGMTQATGHTTGVTVAAAAILIAAASNNVVKGIYALLFADRRTGRLSLLLMTVLGVLGSLPLLWLH
jgi:uncharacterized membrane protein (DUF4010 family)